MANALVIHPDRPPAIKDLRGYRALADEIGGWIEAIPLGVRGVAFVNEDGKRLELPANRSAEALLRLWGWRPMPGDFIVGPVVVFGPHDHEGDVTDVPKEFASQAMLPNS
jgi:Domain of unknown function (DUF3846)